MEKPTELFTPEFLQNPHPTYAWLRDNDPVHACVFPYGNVPMWMVTRYADVRTLLTDDRFSTDSSYASSEFKDAGLTLGRGTEMEFSLPLVDPPQHTRIRRLAMSAFTASAVTRWEEAARAETDILLNQLARNADAELVTQYTTILPSAVIGRILGVPPEDRQYVLRQTQAVTSVEAEAAKQVPEAMRKLMDYARGLVNARRESRGDDLVSRLVAAEEENDGRLSEAELVATLGILVLAGYETTQNLIGNALAALFEFPDQYPALTAPEIGPARAVEEFIRYQGGIQWASFRFAREELEFGGTRLPAGAVVVPVLLSANRDASIWDEPDRLILGRNGPRHVGFGHGIHNCIGASLARLQSRIGISAILTRFPQMKLAVPHESLIYRPSLLTRGLSELPVTLF
ncbi:cytochrome P450 [Microbispora sp. KK1-11]|uniref:cytochrome P450 family protein n=1 Tax=Microbispora sp. KK1-11 TaxID=2053005 RepID=UPI00115B7CD2|nr:cytochrome P450 [Microbispora sp. KK1-11]TQS20834.1 cytochrome P450 [Microbispora sp. KK1-11]